MKGLSCLGPSHMLFPCQEEPPLLASWQSSLPLQNLAEKMTFSKKAFVIITPVLTLTPTHSIFSFILD